jgi:hypothetical protein
MTEGDGGEWIVPTPDEASAAEQAESEKRRGPIQWVRKLLVRGSVGEEKSVTKPPTIGAPPIAESSLPAAMSPPSGAPPDQRSIQRRGSSDLHAAPESATVPPPTPAHGSPQRQPQPAPPPPPANPPRKRRPVRIGEDVRRRRAGSASAARPSAASPGARSLTHGNGYGRCSCGEIFFGPKDVVGAAFATHTCGVDRGRDREDWIFDR